MKRLPSEYIVDHVRLTTQPMPEPQRRQHLHALWEIVHADRTLMFSSDYPTGTSTRPRHALTSFPAGVRERARAVNAVETYGDRTLRVLSFRMSNPARPRS